MEHSQSSEGQVLFRSDHGVPLLWIFAFGERNVWNPGDNVEDRGGIVGGRNWYQTQIDVATTRLEHVESAMKSGAPHLWPWLSAVAILRRKLYTRPKTGFIRIVAPWLLSLNDSEIERWRAATAFAENSIYYLLHNKNMLANESLGHLSDFCPFVPSGSPKDIDKFQKLAMYKDKEEAMRIALVMLGEPDNAKPFEKAVQRDVTKALTDYRDFVSNMSSQTVAKVEAEAAGSKPSSSGGLISRLTGFFKGKAT